jgi:hypothetical protein
MPASSSQRTRLGLNRLRWSAIACALVTCNALVGCGSPGTSAADESAPSDLVGAKLRLMMISEPPGQRTFLSTRLGSVLGGFARGTQDATTSDDWARTRERLRLAGLRAVVVPRAELENLERALDAQPAGAELSLSQSPRWTPVAVGSPLPEPGVVRVHDGLLSLPGGRLRLLLRCYAAPWGEAADGVVPAALRVDLVPQHETTERPRSDFAAALEGPRVRTVEDSGQILTSLAFETLLGPGEVLLIIPELPAAEWRGTLADGSEAPPDDRAGDAGPIPLDQPAPPVPPDRLEFGAGPKPPRPKTVGEWILTDASDLSDASRRLILVIDPILPAEFRLLAPAR